MNERKELSISDYLLIILKWRKIIIRNVLIITAIAVIISLLLSNKYTATATVLPPNPNQDIMYGFIPGSSFGSSSGLSSLAKLGGIVSGVATPSELYSAIMKSGVVKNVIIKKYNLKKEFKAKTMHDTGKKLDDITSITITTEGILKVSVTYKNKYLATDIANTYVEELDKFNNETAMTVGKRYRIFIENRLKETEKSLISAEDSLKQFQEKNRTIDLDIEIKSAIETIAKLKSEIILRQVQKGAWSSVSQLDNPYITNIDRELNEFEKQLAKIEFGTNAGREFGAGFSIPFTKLPQISLVYINLLRNVKIQETVFELLTQQYEQAKIMELKDTPTVQFLDRAAPPEKRSYPKRTLIVLFAFFLGLFCNIPLIFLLEYLEDVKTAPQQHRNYINVINTISADILFYKTRLILLFKKR